MTSKGRKYRCITGRMFELGKLSAAERRFLHLVHVKYETHPEWSRFASWWEREFDKSGLEEGSAVYRICQDLEARLGIAQGKVAPPDYRDYLADLIDEAYGSRYRFCKETGVDPGHLSRVFSSRADLSMESLIKLLQTLQAVLVIRKLDELLPATSPDQASRDLASV